MIKIRSQKITIDLPKEDSEIWVHSLLQHAIKDADYQTTQLVDRVGHVYRSLPQFAAQTITVTDPVTGQETTASGAGIAALIKAMVLAWMVEDCGGTVNEHGDLIKDQN